MNTIYKGIPYTKEYRTRNNKECHKQHETQCKYDLTNIHIQRTTSIHTAHTHTKHLTISKQHKLEQI